MDYNSNSGFDNGSGNGSSYESSLFRTKDVKLDEHTSVVVSFNGESSAISQSTHEQTDPQRTDNDLLEELREILISPEQAEIEHLREDVATLNAWTDDNLLLERMTPVVSRVIEKQIRESPQDAIELLYPLLGGMVNRAVKEAVRNLADRIDAQRQKAFNFQRIFSKFRATSNGVSGGAVDLRDALPFSVDELFVIHSDSGLLIHHESRNPENSHDSDIISAMLTAIGDFVQDAFGHGMEGDLEEIEYGGKRILLEGFQHVYVAAVVDGIESFDYRHEIRRRITAFERDNRNGLIDYGGDPSQLDIHTDSLRKLLFME